LGGASVRWVELTTGRKGSERKARAGAGAALVQDKYKTIKLYFKKTKHRKSCRFKSLNMTILSANSNPRI